MTELTFSSVRRRTSRGIVASLLLGLTLTLVACAPAAAHPTSTHMTFVDSPVTFRADGMTVYGTYRHPRDARGGIPAVLLIAGSGPTDRNGNTPQEPHLNTIRTLATWLGDDGIATLRYDKLGSGRTGLGRYLGDPAAIGITPYEQEAAAGLRFLAAQPHVDRGRLGIFGHSEGGLYALLTATGHGGGIAVPRVHALGLLEPLSERQLTVIETQLEGQIAAAVKAGQLSAANAATLTRTLRDAIVQLRTRATVPAGLPAGLGSLLNPTDARYLRETDRFDPAALGSELPAHMPVLTSCSNDDVQVSCAEVAHLDGGLLRAHVALDAVRLTGVDHILKVDPSRTAAHYDAPLPFSPALRAAIAAFVRRAL